VRLFVALDIPAEVRENLASFLKEMRGLTEKLGDKGVRWVRPENLHVTLKFIGEAAAAKLEGIYGALANVHFDAPLDLRFRGLGFFPDESRPTVLWTRLEASANLPGLASDIDLASATRGIRRENRPFVPHLTLARFAPPILHEKLRAAIQRNWDREFGGSQTRKFHLLESKLKPTGAQYTTLRSFSFVTEA
jgi:RNA 2',3'-cyclic 3'-phosphodiesterase